MIKKITIFLVIFSILMIPVFSFAQTAIDTDIRDQAFADGKSLVPCGNDKDIKGNIINPCSFKDALTLVNGIIKFILFKLVIPIAAIMFFYAGFLMITSGGSAESKTKAKGIFTNAVIGLVIAVGAWLIIKTILSILGYDGAWIGF
ncbi:hypothetical protein EXS45_01880 [Candidatus Nomurabacteria bacterium]|nr:hypothetical protein [Candidatus Nomurabacteria bacterium]